MDFETETQLAHAPDSVMGFHLRHSQDNYAEEVSVVSQAAPETFDINVRVDSPEHTNPYCVSLSSKNTSLLLLPHDPKRVIAQVLAPDNDVWICGSQEIAQAVEGATTGSSAFYLPKGVVLPISGKGAVWAACTTTASVSRISVLTQVQC